MNQSCFEIVNPDQTHFWDSGGILGCGSLGGLIGSLVRAGRALSSSFRWGKLISMAFLVGAFTQFMICFVVLFSLT